MQCFRWQQSLLASELKASVGSSRGFLWQSVRWVSQGRHFNAACENLPRTPSGRNPYDVLELSLTPSLAQPDIAKQYRKLVVECHPDKPGGSTEKMTEVNLAYRILKEHHDGVLQTLQRVQSQAAQTGAGSSTTGFGRRPSAGGEYAQREEFARRARRQATPHTERPRPRRSLNDINTSWETLTRETESAVKSMCLRYEMAIQQGKFLRMPNMLNEITARERWLRKSFIKSLWENVHELRGELLHRGTRSAQQSELAENMVVFASQMQRTLNEDFQTQTQHSVQHQARLLAERGLMVVLVLISLVRFWKWVFSGNLKPKLR